MIRPLDIRDRRYNVRKDSMIGELSDGCLRWVIGSCVITPLPRSVNWIPLGLVRIWSVSCCVLGRLGARDSATSGFTHYPCTLPGLEEDSTAQWFGIMDGCCPSGGCAHDSSVRCQYDGPHFTGFPLCGCSTPR